MNLIERMRQKACYNFSFGETLFYVTSFVFMILSIVGTIGFIVAMCAGLCGVLLPIICIVLTIFWTSISMYINDG